MKKTVLMTAIGAISASSAFSQGLYNIGLGDDEAGESLPLHWTVGASVGYDDNASPLGSDCLDSDESLYVSGYVQANYVSSTPRSTLDVWARLGVVHYLDDIRQTNGVVTSSASDDTFPQLRAGVNYTSRLSERLRVSSRNWVSYEMEPDYDYGFATDRRVGNYLRYSTDNSVGYRFSERFGGIAGYRLTGVSYDDYEGGDYTGHTIYLQGRYRLSPSSVATFGYRYGWTDADAGDSDGVSYVTAGLEHRFSPTTTGVLRAGAQLGDSTTPFVEAALNTQISAQTTLRAFVNYSTSERNHSIGTATCAQYVSGIGASAIYDEATTLRIGLQAMHAVSPRLNLIAGVNYINTSYEGQVASLGGNTVIGDLDESLLNANIGFELKLTDLLSLTGSYNYTTSSSDSDIREYDRQRYQLGVQATF